MFKQVIKLTTYKRVVLPWNRQMGPWHDMSPETTEENVQVHTEIQYLNDKGLGKVISNHQKKMDFLTDDMGTAGQSFAKR